MKIKLTILVSLLTLIFHSCGKTEKSDNYQTYNLSEVRSTSELRLSEIVDDIHLVKLDMEEEHPVSPYMMPWVGDKYILLISRNNILQYTSDGVFTRELIRNGGGPAEFDEVDYYDVNEKKEILYFFDHGFSGRIRRIDLKSGELLSPLKLPDDNRWLLAGFVVYRDRLLCFTNDYSPVDYRYFYIDDEGNTELGSKKKAYLGGMPGVSLTPYLVEINGEVFFRQVRDTLFTLKDDTLAIDMILKEEDYFSPSEDKVRGYSTTLPLNSNNHLLIKSYDLEMIQVDGGGMRLENHDTRLLLVDRNKETIVNVTDFFIDYLGVSTMDFEIYQNDNKAWIVISAIKLIDYIDSALGKDDIDPELKSRLLTLKEEVDEDDNPYLLIGTI